jgi:hypothetical protein
MSTLQNPFEWECLVFTEYLLGCAPHPYVVRKYADAHQVSPVFSNGSGFDFFLVRAARTHGTITKFADAYARLFRPATLLRKKLVLLLAILETCSPSYRLIDSVDCGSRPVLLVRLCGKGIAALLSLIGGVLLFLPVQIIFALIQRSTETLRRISHGFWGDRVNTRPAHNKPKSGVNQILKSATRFEGDWE